MKFDPTPLKRPQRQYTAKFVWPVDDRINGIPLPMKELMNLTLVLLLSSVFLHLVSFLFTSHIVWRMSCLHFVRFSYF